MYSIYCIPTIHHKVYVAYVHVTRMPVYFPALDFLTEYQNSKKPVCYYAIEVSTFLCSPTREREIGSNGGSEDKHRCM